jgi:hypothetical protein
MPCRIDLHPNILSSCLSHVKQHVLLRPITCAPEIGHPIRIDGILPASAHMKSPLDMKSAMGLKTGRKTLFPYAL